MKKVIINIVTFISIVCCITCCNKTKSKEIQEQQVKIIRDTVVDTTCLDSIIILNAKLDSNKTIIDSITSELFVSNYKLGRIRYYNNIAGKGNNIKYLRGWINRTLNK